MDPREPASGLDIVPPDGLSENPELTFCSEEGRLPILAPSFSIGGGEATPPDRTMGTAAMGELRIEAPAESPGEPANPDDPDTPELPGATSSVERYVVRNSIGRGGFGEVSAATQESLRREVAIKQPRRDLLKRAGPEKRQEIERAFREEAYTAAQLEHPNIVPVYALGTSDDGRPLLSMKLVRGTPWNVLLAADAMQLAPDDFLAKHIPVLLQVAQAVAFAHSKGVIHRDLKPSQVMLGEYGEVLLMDWGLAVHFDPETAMTFPVKPVGEGLGFATVATASNPAGTPAYMAPEQTQRNPQNLGPWTDVYLLGGVLYRLLTGKPPHSASTSSRAFLQAAAGIVRPARELAGRPIPDELAELVEHALEAEPKARLSDAKVFAERLRAYLSGASRRAESIALTSAVATRAEGAAHDYREYSEMMADLGRSRALWADNPATEPLMERVRRGYAGLALQNGDLVLARLQAERIAEPEGRRSMLAAVEDAAARIARAERNRRRAYIAAASLGAIIVVVSVVFSVQFSRQVAKTERALAEAQGQRARVQAAKGRADELVRFMLSDLRSTLDEIGRLDAMDKVTSQTLRYVQSIPVEDLTDGDRMRKGATLMDLGTLALDRGNLRDAAERARESNATLAQLKPQTPVAVDEWYSTIAMNNLTQMRAAMDSRDLETFLRLRAGQVAHLEAWRKAAGGDGPSRLLPAQGHLEAITGAYLRAIGQLNRSREHTMAAMDIFERLIARDPGEDAFKLSLVHSLSAYSDSLDVAGDIVGAMGARERQLAMLKDLRSRSPRDLGLGTEIAMNAVAMGNIREKAGDYPAAAAHFDEAMEIMREVVGREPGNLRNVNLWSQAMLSRGDVAKLQKDTTRALALYDEGLASVERYALLDPTNRTAKRYRRSAYNRKAMALEELGRPDEALQVYRDQVAACEEELRTTPNEEYVQRDLVVYLMNVAAMLSERGELREPLALMDRAIELQRGIVARNPDLRSATAMLIQMLTDAADTNERVAAAIPAEAAVRSARAVAMRKELAALQEDARRRADEVSRRRDEQTWDAVVKGRALAASGDRPGAEARWEQVVLDMKGFVERLDQRYPMTPQRMQTYVAALLELGRNDEARPHVEGLAREKWAEWGDRESLAKARAAGLLP